MEFAQRTNNVKSSEIRKILAATQNENMISFAGGLPAPWLFPEKELEFAAQTAIQKHGKKLLQYSVSQGLPELREYIAHRMKRKTGVELTPEEILITSGSQQGLDLIGRIFLEPQKNLYLEKPVFSGALQTFSFWQPVMHGIDLLADGPDLALLAHKLDRNGPGLFYFIPNFQNPSSLSYSRTTREKLSRLAADKNLLLVEDDPYGDLRYTNEDIPPVISLHKNTIYLGSFSKIVAPGLRIGWLTAPKNIMEKLLIAKQATDLHTGSLAQGVLLQYLKNNDLDCHIEKMKKAYSANCKTMCDTLTVEFPEITFSKPEGGMFVWCQLPPGINAMEFSQKALQKGVAVVTGNAFYFDGKGPECIRLNFSNQTQANIVRGVKILQQVYLEMKNETV